MKLADEHIWTIICAPASVSTTDLAAALGVPFPVMHRLRSRFRRDGWTCALAYVTCAECAELVTNDLVEHPKRMHHPACRPVEGFVGIFQSGELRRDATELHEEQLSNDFKRYKPWTDAEDAVLISPGDLVTTTALAQSLMRTKASVLARRQKLRKAGCLD